MGTPALIKLDSPDRGTAEFIRVHYDGGPHTRDTLAALIARDGYPAVRQTLLGQTSRFWVGLDSAIHDLPPYVADYPAAWTAQAVPGYGLVFGGAEEVAASVDQAAFDPNTWSDQQWHVTAGGRVSAR